MSISEFFNELPPSVRHLAVAGALGVLITTLVFSGPVASLEQIKRQIEERAVQQTKADDKAEKLSEKLDQLSTTVQTLAGSVSLQAESLKQTQSDTDRVDRRLDRIEDKLDRVITNTKK